MSMKTLLKVFLITICVSLVVVVLWAHRQTKRVPVREAETVKVSEAMPTGLLEQSSPSNSTKDAQQSYHVEKSQRNKTVSRHKLKSDIQFSKPRPARPALNWANLIKEANNQMKQANQMKEPNITLPSQVIAGVKKFVFFVGYSRSGHSIVGTLMDAHPHVIIPHEFMLFQNFRSLNRVPDSLWRDNLYNRLYKKSAVSADKIRANPIKGYTLGVTGLSQGTYDRYVEVIGDKSGSMTTSEYISSKRNFISNYEKLKRMVSVPVCVIHVVRNPFDMIATGVIINEKGNEGFGLMKKESETTKIPIPDAKFYKYTDYKFEQFGAVTEMIENVFGRENVLELHNCDLVADPRGTLTKIFDFLEVNTTEHYLDVCAEKVFKSVSRSRDLMEWTPEQRETVEQKMKKYEMFNRYNFTSQ